MPDSDSTPPPTLASTRLVPEELARLAGLRYVRDSMPGITRLRWGKGFTYRDPSGETIRDRDARRRFEALAIPPAWTDVWICQDPDGHLQATGRDARGRKQYRYHPRWDEIRQRAKFSRIIAMGVSLPRIRRTVGRDLGITGLSRERVLAAVVRLLDRTLVRVGYPRYARENQSFGITTLRGRHVAVDGHEIALEFTGKSGKEHQVDLRDPELAEVLRECAECAGHEIFTWLDAEGARQTVEGEDVNEYLRRVSGHDLTAKDFRTWAGTVAAVRALQDAEPADTEKDRKKQVVDAVKTVAATLGNEPATCRSFYIHPAVLTAHEEGTLLDLLDDLERHPPTRTIPGYRRTERTVLALLPRLEGLQEERIAEEGSDAGADEE